MHRWTETQKSGKPGQWCSPHPPVSCRDQPHEEVTQPLLAVRERRHRQECLCHKHRGDSRQRGQERDGDRHAFPQLFKVRLDLRKYRASLPTFQRWGTRRRFQGSDLSISNVFSVIYRKIRKPIYFHRHHGMGGKMSETATCFQQHHRMDLHFSYSSPAD